MTFLSKPKLVATVILATMCIGSTAHAADPFNKFPEQSAAATKQAPKVTTYIAQAASKTKEFAKKRRVKRVEEPVATSMAFVQNADSSRMTTRFNKMVSKSDKTMRGMPVINKHELIAR